MRSQKEFEKKKEACDMVLFLRLSHGHIQDMEELYILPSSSLYSDCKVKTRGAPLSNMYQHSYNRQGLSLRVFFIIFYFVDVMDE